MAVKKFNKITIRTNIYQPIDKTPERSIEEVIGTIKELGGKGTTIIATKQVDEIPNA